MVPAGFTDRKPIVSFKLADGTAHVFARTTDVLPHLWERAFGKSLKDFAYYQLIEDTLGEYFTFRYLLICRVDGAPIALQPLIITDQDLAASAPRGIQLLIGRIRSLWPRFLRSKMLMAGCLVGDGALGVIDGDLAGAAPILAEAVSKLAGHERISLITLKDFPATQRTELNCLRSNGYARLDSFPALELPLTVASFEDYLDTKVSKATRKNIRRKLRHSDSVRPSIQLEVLEDASGIIDDIYPLYLNVASRGAVTFEVFTRSYFLEAGRRMPGRFRYFVWRQNHRVVAFSFCTLFGEAIYDNDIGLDYTVAHEFNLYYVTFRDIIVWALAHGLTRYYSAPFNYEPKLRLGMDLLRVDAYVRHRSDFVNSFLKRLAPHFAPAKSDRALREYYKS